MPALVPLPAGEGHRSPRLFNSLMWFCSGRWLAGDLHEDPHKTRAVLHGHFIAETPGRILQKGVGKLEGPDSDVTLTVTSGDTANHPGIAVDAIIAHEAAGCQRG